MGDFNDTFGSLSSCHSGGLSPSSGTSKLRRKSVSQANFVFNAAEVDDILELKNRSSTRSPPRYLSRRYPPRSRMEDRIPSQIKAAHKLARELSRKALGRDGSLTAFPFGKARYPYVPKRKEGGSLMAMTECKMRQFLEHEDAKLTHKSIYENDHFGGSSWGMTPFIKQQEKRSSAATSTGASGNVFDTLGDEKCDDFAMIFAAEQQPTTFLQ